MKLKSLLMTALLLPMAAQAETLPYQDASLSATERAADLVSRLTLEEKIDQIGHKTQAVTRLGLQGYNYWNEALHGVARSGLATSFPVSKAMSSTWNKELMFDVATVISDECRIYNSKNNKGLIYWCPTINMSRDPRWGRDEENYGEDPYLTGTLAVEYIKGMQGNDPKHYKTIATAKHFAANNYEAGRHNTSSNMDDRNLREYYLPAFEMAVKEGNVRSIMSAYNAVNGIPSGANEELLEKILRQEWGFDGFITSDCAAVYDVYGKHKYVATGEEASAISLKAGEDLNCGDTFQQFCKSAIEKGLMTEADIDKALTRVLAARFSVGEFDAKADVKWSSVSESLLDCQKHRDLALEASRQAIVLLKNDNNFLPLDRTKSVALIGPLADIVSLGGYSGSPVNLSTPLEGIADKIGYTISDGKVQFEDCTEQSIATGSKRLTHEANGSGGNLGYIFNNDWVAFPDVNLGAGKSLLTVYHGAKNNNPTIVHFYLDNMEGEPAVSVTCPTTGNWATYVETSVQVDPAIFSGVHKIYTKFEGGTNGDKYCANMDWFSLTDPNAASPLETDGPLYYVKGCDVNGTDKSGFDKAIEIAKKADYVIFCGGTDLETSDEGKDRQNLNLPGVQQELLEKIYAANPNIVLLLESCSSLTINWAQQNVPAIVEAWYDGQSQGEAIADVIYGDYNPCGHLTSTWYNALGDLPTGMLNYDIRKAGYTYMYYKKTPLYPFGHGLSYTTFDYSDLALSTTHLEKEKSVEVSVTVKNTGAMKGADVVQLYAHYDSAIERPRLQLVGYGRVELEPGESKTVTIPVKHEQFAYFNEATQTFDVEQGDVKIYVGKSSADLVDSRDLTTESATVKTTYKTAANSVSEFAAEQGLCPGVVYNMSGQAVGTESDLANLAPGFYILNGKKLVK